MKHTTWRGTEEEVGKAINDGRYDVARALVTKLLGGWDDKPGSPSRTLAQEIVDDPYAGIELVLNKTRPGAERPIKVKCRRCEAPLDLYSNPNEITRSPSTGVTNFSKSADWIEHHRKEYDGQWVALFGSDLIDHDVSRLKLQQRIKNRSDIRKLLLVKVSVDRSFQA